MDVNNHWVYVYVHWEWEVRIGCLSFPFVQNIPLQPWKCVSQLWYVQNAARREQLECISEGQVIPLSISIVCFSRMLLDSSHTHEWERNTSPSESWTEVHKSYYEVMWPLRQENKSKILVLNIKRTQWTTVMAVSNTVSHISIHMQNSQDCKDWLETEHLYFCYITYGSGFFFFHYMTRQNLNLIESKNDFIKSNL